MPQGKTIYFVTYPDGKVDEASINIYSQSLAMARCIAGWLPERFFGTSWANEYSMVVSELWRNMAEKGFKAHSIDWPEKLS